MVAINYRVDHVKKNKYSRPGDKLLKVQAGVIHYTANKYANAEDHQVYFDGDDGGAYRYAGAHIFIDKHEAVEIIPLDEVAYHANERKAGPLLPSLKASTSFYPGGNANLLTIGLEMCIEEDGTFHPDTIARTQLVCKRLQKQFPALRDTKNRFVRHYDITGKNCPAPYVASPSAWNAFLAGIDAPVIEAPKVVVPPKPKYNSKYTSKPEERLGTVVLKGTTMNYRTEPDINAPIVKQLPAYHGADPERPVHLYEVKGEWLRLGRGWISNAKGAYAVVKLYDKKEEEEMKKQVIVVNATDDFPAALRLSNRIGAGLVSLFNAKKEQYAKEAIVVGGSATGIKADKVTNLSGDSYFTTAAKVDEYISKL
ncbi:peptidoglycan recognition protein family protein [Jeotgalibacillus campisalis]|uniref:N-acetylmuramoyl-L-alanine amidase n=1 Tax=Jeotgalibacillus campisalis TaxID=220754 RepID=A0A0C2VB36_9BACL|nr:N-acetylmuramoyl-L-alanine amidase [Jeotgalibacillus campisalis]KIL46142.1 N-acetylmuramoyl-L-alanine amidase [Jeotgalibacillus campisalis]